MLAYEQTQQPHFSYPGQHLNHQNLNNKCASPDWIRSRSTSKGQRTPLLAVQNCCSRQPQELSYLDTSRGHMQSFSKPSQQLSHDHSPPSGNDGDVMAQESGLGIMGGETMFGSAYQTSGVEQSPYLAYDEQTGSAISNHAPKLASPFGDGDRTYAAGWHVTYPSSTLSDGYRNIYGSKPSNHFLEPEHGQPGLQYSMSPAELISDPFQYGNIQHGQFKRPMVRHNSTLNDGPQSTNFPYTTPNVETSSFQWTPQSATPGWQDTTQYFPDSASMPTVILDYAAYNAEDQMPQFVQPQQRTRTAMTVPQRRKPHLRPSLSESCVPRLSSPARMRSASMGRFLQAPPYPHYADTWPIQQLPLPPLPPSVLIHTPQIQRPSSTVPGTPAPSHRPSRSCSSTPIRRKRPTSPPSSDFAGTNMSYLVPTRQEPAFPGDLYTPRYKRRTLNGRWEGWCGYCQPGRWLDLKNSRFWEDKLRNHGICAKTKMRFAEPEKIRWVTTDGFIVPEQGIEAENSDLFQNQRKREGFCGTCNTWVGMDGLRTKARDRAVGWWMHAYKVRLGCRKVKRQANV